MMQPQVIRRNLDARLVSYAVQISKDEDLARKMEGELNLAATSVIQAASGLRALMFSMKAAADAKSLHAGLNAKQYQSASIFFDSLAQIFEDAWAGAYREALELILVVRIHGSRDEEWAERLRTAGALLGLDLREPAIHEDDDIKEDAALADIPIDEGKKREPNQRKRKRIRSSKESYERERLDNIVTKAIAQGIDRCKPVLVSGVAFVVGISPKGDIRLAKLRSSIEEARVICEKANEEIRSFHLQAKAAI